MTNIKQAITLRSNLTRQIISRASKYGASGYDIDDAIDAIWFIIRLRTDVYTINTPADYDKALGILNDILPEVSS